MSNVALIRGARTEMPAEALRSPDGAGLVPVVTVMARLGDVEGVLHELSFLIDALLGSSDRQPGAARGGPAVSVGELYVDPGAHRVTVGEDEVSLTGLEFKLLMALLARRDRVLTREALLCGVWRCSAECKTRTVDTHVKRLRDKLRTAGRFVQTIRGVGYRFSEKATGGEGSRRRRPASFSGPAQVAIAGR